MELWESYFAENLEFKRNMKLNIKAKAVSKLQLIIIKKQMQGLAISRFLGFGSL